MPFRFERQAIPEVIVIEPEVYGDVRGSFMETYKRSDFAAAGIDEEFVQENQSRSQKNVLRGLHYQVAPHSQSKLIRVLSGSIFDVAVDIRPHSPTRGKWVGVTLSADARRMIYIPDWCAHGFYVLTDCADVLYHTSVEYKPDAEAGIIWSDPVLNIEWPGGSPIVSDRDKSWPSLAGAR